MSVSRSVLLTTLTLLLCLSAFAQRRSKQKQPDIVALKKQWVDSVYNMLTEDERIGQMFMVAAYSGTKEYNEELVTKLINNHQVGGLIFMQGGPLRQANLTNYYQRIAQVPLLIAMDAEWGIGMRLDSVKKLPRQMMIGATRDTATAFRVGGVIARQCNRLGVNIDFAPDVDVNNNVMNPVINTRSYGEDKTWVAKMGVAYMRGLQSNGVIACAKHFPGHGDTHVDSHNDMPLIPKSLAQLDTLELVPFKQAISAGIKSIMIAHLEVPSLEKQPHVPTTLSKNTITGLLKDKLGFEGLVITDAMNMQGITKYFKDGDAELMAFKAGNDLILMSPDIPTAIARIKTALAEGAASWDAVETSVKKILAAKYEVGLSRWKDIDTRGLWEDLNQYVDGMRQTVAKGAITLVRDDNQVMNKINYTMRVGYVGINANNSTPLYEALNDKFNNVRAHWLPKGTSLDSTQKVLDRIADYDATIIAVHNLNYTPGNNYGLSNEAIAFLQYAGCRNNTMVVLMGNAYAMQYFCGAGSVMVGYEDDTITENTVADVLFKKIKPKGKLPVTACLGGKSVCPVTTKIPELANEPAYRLRKVFYPADAGVVDQKSLDRIDMFMARNIANGVFPGCRVLAAKDGKIFYDRAFGYMKYDKERKVDTNTLYDVASCTKVLSTTLAVMRLYEQGKIALDRTLGDYLPQAKNTNKENLKIKDILLHQAGLKGWIPFYKDVSEDNGDPRADLFKHKQTEGYGIEVAKDLWMRTDYLDTMWEKIYTSRLDNTGKMVYSDLDFYFLAAVVKQITGKTIDKYVDDEFYKPMGLKRITYLPLKKFSESQIAPTEIDQGFRNQTLCGYVHDPGAAMLGGVGGHAGLFATAQDVAAIFQMLLNKGSFNGKRYFKASTVDLFTAYGSRLSHRALGFDKPLPQEDNGGGAGDRVTASAFGHQGFTGTCVWADPGTGIVFVFLSNRVYPSGSNTKINKLSVRTTAQDYIYESLGYPVNHERPQGYKAQVGTGK